MQDGTYPSRDFATLGPSGLRPPFTGIYKATLSLFFILQHWAGVRLYTSYFYLAKSYVFNKQSLPPLQSRSFSSLYPEVTETFCRVPLVLFTLLPVFTQLADLCWYLYDYFQILSNVFITTHKVFYVYLTNHGNLVLITIEVNL